MKFSIRPLAVLVGINFSLSVPGYSQSNFIASAPSSLHVEKCASVYSHCYGYQPSEAEIGPVSRFYCPAADTRPFNSPVSVPNPHLVIDEAAYQKKAINWKEISDKTYGEIDSLALAKRNSKVGGAVGGALGLPVVAMIDPILAVSMAVMGPYLLISAPLKAHKVQTVFKHLVVGDILWEADFHIYDGQGLNRFTTALQQAHPGVTTKQVGEFLESIDSYGGPLCALEYKIDEHDNSQYEYIPRWNIPSTKELLQIVGEGLPVTRP